MPKKMDVANKPTQNTQEITVMAQHAPKCGIRTTAKVRGKLEGMGRENVRMSGSRIAPS